MLAHLARVVDLTPTPAFLWESSRRVVLHINHVGVASLDEAFKKRELVAACEHAATTKQSQQIVVRGTTILIVPVVNEMGDVHYVFGAAEKTMADAPLVLHEINKNVPHFSQIVHLLDQIVLTARADGCFDFVSRRWYEVTGRGIRNGELDSTVRNACSATPRFMECWSDGIASNSDFKFEMMLATLHGHRWHELRAVPTFIGTALTKWIVTLTDVHKAVQARSELAELRTRLELMVDVGAALLATGAEEAVRASLAAAASASGDWWAACFNLSGEAVTLMEPLSRDAECLAAALADLAPTVPMFVNDVKRASGLSESLRQRLELQKIASFACVTASNETYRPWALCVFSRRRKRWNARDVALVNEISDRLSAAVQRKRVEEALRDSERHFRQLANLVPEFIAESAADGTALWYNDRWAQFTALDIGRDSLKYTWLEGIVPIDRPSFTEAWQHALERGDPFEVEGRVRRSDGAYRWFLFRVEPVADHNATVQRWLSTGTDVHDKRTALEHIEAQVALRTAELKRANHALVLSAQEAASLRRRLTSAEEGERRRLSRELHDHAGQQVTALGLGLRTLSNLAPAGSDLEERARELTALVESLGSELHSLAVQLRPATLDDYGLRAAVLSYSHEWSKRYGIEVDVHADVNDRLDAPVEDALYRILQEGLTNVARHSNARSVSVVLEIQRSEVLLIVEDDGVGAGSPSDLTRSEGLGLRGIRERVALLGGELEIDTAAGQGLALFVRLPLLRALME